MGRHGNAWAGLNIMVYGSTPLLPMNVEQAIAEVTPDNEVKIDSYENYEDALNFANAHGSVGFFLILENCGKLQPSQVFNELSRAYRKRGWPALGILVHEGAQSISGLQTLRKNPEIFDYLSIEDFTDSTKVAETLDKVWGSFVEAIENSLLPLGLQQTLISLSTDVISEEEVRFLHRLKSLLESNLNLTWLESFALKWSSVIQAVSISHPTALHPHARLKHVVSTVQSVEFDNTENLIDISKAKATLSKRLDRIIKVLVKAYRENRLNEVFTFLSTQNKPGAPAIVRHLVSYRDRILQFADEERTSNTSIREVG